MLYLNSLSDIWIKTVTPDMSYKVTIFYREKILILLDFSAEDISSDGAIILFEKLERKEKLIRMN